MFFSSASMHCIGGYKSVVVQMPKSCFSLIPARIGAEMGVRPAMHFVLYEMLLSPFFRSRVQPVQPGPRASRSSQGQRRSVATPSRCHSPAAVPRHAPPSRPVVTDFEFPGVASACPAARFPMRHAIQGRPGRAARPRRPGRQPNRHAGYRRERGAVKVPPRCRQRCLPRSAEVRVQVSPGRGV